MTIYETVITAFKEMGYTGMTRAECSFLLFTENSQHLVCKPILDGIKAGVLVELEDRRPHPVKGRSGKVVIYNDLNS